MRLLILFIIGVTISLSAQNRVLVYLKDKGPVNEKTFSKTSASYTAALGSLSERSLLRRAKDATRPLADYTDVPVNEEYVRQIEALGYKVVYRLKWFNALSVIVPEGQSINNLSLPFVEKTEPVKRFLYRSVSPVEFTAAGKQQLTPPPTNYGFSLPQLALSGIPQLHKLGINGRGALIGFLDSGFDWKNHEALKSRDILAERDFVFHDYNTANEPGDTPGQHDHGTYCLSIAGGYKDSALIGVAYDAKFVLAKTEDIRSETHIEEDNYAAALQWMDSIGVDITSGSLGYNIFDTGGSYKYSDMNGATTIVTKAAELAYSKGILTVAAAGNEGNGSWKYIVAPSDGVFTLAVAAVTTEDSVASFSSIGPSSDGRIKPDVAAVGADCYGARASSKSGYLWNSGTSAATPIVSGVAGLLVGVYPHLNNAQLRNMLQQSGNTYFTPNYYRGYGLISAIRALEIPNLQSASGTFTLHKFFYTDSSSVVYANAFVTHNGKTDSLGMTSLGQGRFSVSLPVYSSGTRLNVSFKAVTTTGATIVYPAAGSEYSVSYGSLVFSKSKQGSAGAVNEYELELPAPNPFSAQTTFSLIAPKDGNITVSVYNITGERVQTLYNGFLAKGVQSFVWNARNSNGNTVADGVYVISVETPSGVLAKKVLHLRKSQ